MDASYSFSVGTPSSATFAPYESSANSLTTSTPTVTFSPDEKVSNPYYNYAQNDLVIDVSNAVTYSSSSSNSASTTFDITSTSYTSSTSPTWDVDLYLYGNVAPKYVSGNVAFTGSSDTAQLDFNATQPDFGGESLTLLVSWGDGSTSTLTGNAPYNFTAQHSYASTGTFTITATLENSPNPSSNGLSSLSASAVTYTYTIAVYPSPSPKPLAQLETGDHIYLNFTTLHDIVHEVTLRIDGSPVDSWVINRDSGSLSYNPSTYAGKTGFSAT